MTGLRKYAEGEKFKPKAVQLNAWTEAVESTRTQKANNSERQRKNTDSNRHPVKNNTGGDLPAFSVLQITDPLVDPDTDLSGYKSKPAMIGGEASTTDAVKFAITQRWLGTDGIDEHAILSGVTFARLTGPTGKEKAQIKSGQTTLEAADTGGCVILVDPGSEDEGNAEGERLAVVRIDGGGSSCTTQFAIWISGRPTGGSFSFPVTISGSPETITVNWDAEGEAPGSFDPMTDDTADYIDTALAEHTEIALADVTVTTPGGSFPYQVLRFSIANASSEVLIGNQTDSFTGGTSPYTTIDKCCG